MIRVNYVRECRAFQTAAGEKQITANEVALWHALFELFNRKAEGDRWPEGFIPFSNAQLLSMTPFGSGDSGVEILRRAREKLVKRGFIHYKPGLRKSRMPEYSLVYFYPETLPAQQGARERSAGGACDLKAYPRKDKGKDLDHSADTVIAKLYDPSLNLNGNQKPDHTQLNRDGTNPRAGEALPASEAVLTGQEYDLGWKTSARARGAVAQRLLDLYRGRLDTADPWGDLCELMAQGLPPEAIELALPTRPCFSRLVARLRAMALCLGGVPGPPE